MRECWTILTEGRLVLFVCFPLYCGRTGKGGTCEGNGNMCLQLRSLHS